MGAISTAILTFLVTASAFASSTILQVTGYDFDRQRAQIALSQDAIVPVGTRLRINALNGESCIIEVMERVNNTLIAKTPDCTDDIVRSGLRLAYSDGRSPDFVSPSSEYASPIPEQAPVSYDVPMAETANTNNAFDNPVEEISPTHPLMNDNSLMADESDWPSEGQYNSPSATSGGGSSIVSSESLIPSDYAMLRDRISVYIGHNFSSDLEGKVYADGSYKDLDGNSAFSLGVQGQVYDITPKIGVTMGLGYEFARSFDEATLTQNNVQYKGNPPTGNPRLTLWSLYTQVEGELLDKLNAFGGINFSIPFLSRVTWDAKTDIGFQAGANYLVYDRVRVEGLIKISNLNLTNEFGQTTDVSLAGVEIRGRYTF